jgi:hypothetical protein
MPQPELEPPAAAAQPARAGGEVVATAVALLEAAALAAAMGRGLHACTAEWKLLCGTHNLLSCGATRPPGHPARRPPPEPHPGTARSSARTSQHPGEASRSSPSHRRPTHAASATDALRWESWVRASPTLNSATPNQEKARIAGTILARALTGPTYPVQTLRKRVSKAPIGRLQPSVRHSSASLAIASASRSPLLPLPSCSLVCCSSSSTRGLPEPTAM